jgi:hypothetical protein
MYVYPASVLSRAGARQTAKSGRIGNREFVFFELMGLKKAENFCDRKFSRDRTYKAVPESVHRTERTDRVHTASMRPRLISRGNATHCDRHDLGISRFNEAPADQPGK